MRLCGASFDPRHPAHTHASCEFRKQDIVQVLKTGSHFGCKGRVIDPNKNGERKVVVQVLQPCRDCDDPIGKYKGYAEGDLQLLPEWATCDRCKPE